MRKTCCARINDQVFSAFSGDILLDAARKAGIDIPYDCASGHCGACYVRVVDGLTVGGECQEPGTVRACRARIMSDLHLKLETLPQIQTVAGEVSAIRRRAPDVVEVKIEPSEPITYLPGQYLRIQFRGFPTRCYNPTAPMEEILEPEYLHLQVRQFEGGQVSPAIGSDIREGHRVQLRGPLGSAFLRPASQHRLVLVATSTGFAAVWSIAVAAIRENQRREIFAVVGAHSLQSLYMVDALCMLAHFPNVTIIPVVETPQRISDVIRIGHVTDYIPELSPEDSVHVCGPLPLVEAVTRIAAEADALCYCVSFAPQHGDQEALETESSRESTLARAREWPTIQRKAASRKCDVIRRGNGAKHAFLR
jgi:NAD(P)H-flavin reductase